MMRYLEGELMTGAWARLLIVDDEPNIRSPLVRVLSLAGYEVEEANSGQEALSLLGRTPYDLVVLELVMPDMSGLEVIRQARHLCPDVSIIILTGHATCESAIAAAKADEVVDYLCKPVKNDEIINAVAKAVKKRTQKLLQQRLLDVVSQILDIRSEFEAPIESKVISNSFVSDPETIIAPPLILNRKKRIVTVEKNPPRIVELTKGEMAILTSLMAQAGQVLSCEELVNRGWGYETDEFEAQSIVRPHIYRLRQKLEPDPKEPHLICTVRRRGYCLKAAEKNGRSF